MGRRLSPPRPTVLSKARLRRPLYARYRPPAHCRCADAARAAPRRCVGATRRTSAVFTAHSLSGSSRSGAMPACGAADARERAIPLDQCRIQGFRRFSGDHESRQAQKHPPGAPQARGYRDIVSPAGRKRYQAGALGLLFSLLCQDVRRAPFDALFDPGFFCAARQDALRQCSAGPRRKPGRGHLRRSGYLQRHDALGPLLGNKNLRSRPPFRSMLLPGDRILHRARDHLVRGRCARRAQARARPDAGNHTFCARHCRSRVRARHRRLSYRRENGSRTDRR